MSQFTVGITRDFLNDQGRLGFGDIDIGLGLLEEAGIRYDFLPENTPELRPDQIEDCDGLLVLAPRITRETLRGADRLAVVARFGVGFDSVDVPACTEHGVAVTITPDGVRRPVAVATMAMLLALVHRLPDKDRLVREGRWNDKLSFMGTGTTGRTLGIVGFGRIGRDVARVAPFLGARLIATDPYVDPAEARALGVELVGLEDLLRQSDFVTVHCALTPETHHLLDAERLRLLKPTAYLVNMARGPVIDQVALAEALRERRFAGAGIDVFEQEPPDPGDPLLRLDNVILAPHALCWTDECFTGNGRQACQSIVDVAAGRAPEHVVDPDVLHNDRYLAKAGAQGGRSER